MVEQGFKRHVAHKMRIGDVLSGKIIMDGEKFKFLEVNESHIVRVNIIANITDKFVQDDEKKYATLTIDDASGQIRIKSFGDEIEKLEHFIQGDTIIVVGLLRTWNNEVYITPEIIKKREPQYLMVRKLELDLEKPKILEKDEISQIRTKILDDVRKNEENGGIDIEKIILDLQQPPQTINQEIKKLLEEGLIYEPRPGKLRYLG